MRKQGPPYAESLLYLAERMGSSTRLTIVADALTEHELAITALALKFKSMPARFKFRALIEEWDHERLVREIY
jgi:hypothetical protein